MLADGRWIKVSEMTCHDGTPYPEELGDHWIDIRDTFDVIRPAWGAIIDVISGYRTNRYNGQKIAEDKKRGSHQVASGSKHVLGWAIDGRPRSGKQDAPQLYRVIMGLYDAGKLPKLGGLALYPISGWVHFDCDRAADGHLRKWIGT